MKFTIETNPYDDNKPLYRRKNIEIKPGLTVLVGCNGCGKTTLLQSLQETVHRNEIPYIKYNNLTDGGTNATSAAMFHGDMRLAATMMCSSEGERISINLANTAKNIGNMIKELRNKENSQMFIFIDAADSGLSIDNIEDVKKYLFRPAFEVAEGIELYIIVSANDYTMTKDENCFDVYTGNYKTFKNYDEYYKFIMQSRERKEKRFKQKEGK